LKTPGSDLDHLSHIPGLQRPARRVVAGLVVRGEDHGIAHHQRCLGAPRGHHTQRLAPVPPLLPPDGDFEWHVTPVVLNHLADISGLQRPLGSVAVGFVVLAQRYRVAHRC